jgi:hypothetical protein
MTSQTQTKWDIRAEGRSWTEKEAMPRYFSITSKIEMVGGKLFYDDQDRENLLCLLLENVGAERVVQFGDPKVWRAAIDKLEVNQ